MAVRRGARTIGLLTAAGVVAASVLVAVSSQTVSAATLNSPPERLYMAPTGTLLPPVGVPVGTMPMTGTDPISGDSRLINVTTPDGPGGCTLQAPAWSLTGCSRVQLQVSHGLLTIGEAGETQFRNGDPAFPVYPLAGGAVIDQITNPPDLPSLVIQINGTEAQLNAALANLVYTPDPGYYYTGSNLEYLSVVVSDASNVANNVSKLVEIMVLDTNSFPTMTGPGTQNADPEVELVISNGYQVDDEDNDEDVDGAQADPPVPLPDPVDGANNAMLLVGVLECGSAILANSGFHLQGGAFQQDNGDLSDLLDTFYDVNNDPFMADVVTAIENGINAIDPNLLTTVYTTSNPSVYTSAFAGIGSMEEVRYALDEITFLHYGSGDTCTLTTVVSDLGNNGLPLQYVGSPPDGFEIPIPGFDFHTLTINLGDLPEVDASFAGGAFVLEGDSAQATINITPATHPAFDLHFTVLSGTAISTSDFPQLIDLTVNVPENATSVVVDNNTFGDTDPEGDETFTFQIVAPTDPPPGAFTRPAGWEVTTNTPTAPMVLVDDDDGDNTLNVSIEGTATIDEGETGPVTISISPASHPAFQLQINTGDDTAVAPGDYTAQTDQPVIVPANATSVDVDLTTIENLIDEPDKSFTVALSVTASPPPGYAISLGNTLSTVTIADDDVPVDTTNPDVTINQGSGQSDPTSTSPIIFDVVFTEPVTGFTTGDVTLSGTAGATTAVVSGGPTSYTVTVSGMTQDGTVIASIGATVAIDAAANPNDASTSTDNTVTFDFAEGDTTNPDVTINQGSGQGDPTSTSPIIFDVVFTEPVTGFATGDVNIGGTAGATTAVVSGGPSAYTVTVSGMTQDGTVIVAIGATVAIDAAANPNDASTSTDNTVTFDFAEGDTTNPDVTINQGSGQGDPTSTSPIIFDVVFTEPVTGFATGDVNIGGTAGATTAVVSGGPSAYTVTVSGMTQDGTVIVAIGATVAIDAAANPNDASTSTDNTVTFDFAEGDTTNPDVTINQGGGQTDPTSVSPIIFDVVFTEPVTGFATGDITLSGTAGATTAAVSGGPTSYTVTVTGMTQDGTVIATIASSVAVDAAANPNDASTSTDNTVTFDFDEGDTTNPDVTINQGSGQTDPTSTSPIIFDVVFTEPVTGFADGDVTLSGTAGATTAVVSGGPTTYTVAVTGMTNDGTVVASINSIVAVDGANNPNTVSTSTDNTVTFDFNEGDVTDPDLTINQGGGQSDPTAVSPIVFDVVFTEPVTGFATGDVTLSGTAGATTAVVSGGPTTYTVTVSGMTQDGTVIATVSGGVAIDAAANSNDASTSTDNTVTFDFNEAAPPIVLTVPANVTVSNEFGQAGAVVTYPAATASGGVPPIVIVCSPVSGSFFPIGTTVVTCTATDSAPNVKPQAGRAGGGRTETIATGTFTVTVTDTQPPTIVDPPDVSITAVGNGAVVSFATPPANDNAPGVTVTCNPPSGSVFPIGVTTVTCTATDGAGNTSSITFSVSVVRGRGLPATGSSTGWPAGLALAFVLFGIALLVGTHIGANRRQPLPVTRRRP